MKEEAQVSTPKPNRSPFRSHMVFWDRCGVRDSDPTASNLLSVSNLHERSRHSHHGCNPEAPEMLLDERHEVPNTEARPDPRDQSPLTCPEDRRACEAGVRTSWDLLGKGHTELTTLPAASWAASPSPRAVGLFRVQHRRGIDVHWHLHPQGVPSVFHRPESLLPHPEALGRLHPGRGTHAYSHGLQNPEGAQWGAECSWASGAERDGECGGLEALASRHRALPRLTVSPGGSYPPHRTQALDPKGPALVWSWTLWGQR
ncbi:uncharacterized protein AAEQ78_021126 isoform 1-T1 [Lycaon pictus]